MSHSIRLIFVLSLVLDSWPSVCFAQPCGDCDLNGVVNILDALVAAQDSARIQPVPPQAFPFCDVDSSSVVTIIDALRIAQIAAGLPVVLICDSPPVAFLIAPTPPVFLDVPVDYTLSDAEGYAARVRLDFSTDGGVTYRPASAAPGTQTTGLTAPPPPSPPVRHTFVWRTLLDIGGGTQDDVMIRLIPTDGRTSADGAPSFAGPFDISNFDIGSWTLQSPSGSPPSARYGAASFTHSPNLFMIHLGGRGTLRLTDSRSLFSAIAPGSWADPAMGQQAPGGRIFSCGVHDPVFQRHVLFGGEDVLGVPLSRLLVLGGSPLAWSEPGVAGTDPGARSGAVALHDAARNRMLVIGGHDGSRNYAEVWALSLAQSAPGPWSLVTAGGIPAMSFMSAAIDAPGDRMFVFGGRGTGPVYSSAMYAMDFAGGGWVALPTAGVAPRPRAGAGLLYDRASQRLLVAGGGDDAVAFDDVIALDLNSTPSRWRPLGITSPVTCGGRLHAAWFLDSSGDILVSGGTDPVTGVASSLWKLDR